jgi:hypothetical protein
LFDLNVEVRYFSSEGISSFKIEYPNIKNEKKVLNLMLNPDGYFDVVYSKSFIKSAGLCQSILFEVSYIFLKKKVDDRLFVSPAKLF